jgi:histidyl-tRNA synthetase
VAENFDTLAKPYRSYRYGWVFRNEKPGPGRFRQFMQFDADTIGSGSPAADAEMCMMAADTMEALGVPRGQYVVKVNNRKVLDGVLETINLGGEANAGKRLTVLRAIDKVDRLGVSGVRELLGPGRKDDSGDFTKGANLDEASIQTVLSVIEPPKDSEEKVAQIDLRLGSSAVGQEGRAELELISNLIMSAGYEDRVRLDPTVVRGLEYYTGAVFEVELLLETKDEKGRPVRFGSVGGGGRYDGLVSRFRNEPVPSTGFSVGVSRLLAALVHLKKIDTTAEPGPVVVTTLDQEPARIADYQRMVATLRAAGIPAELYLGKGKFGPQMKYADKRNAPCVVIQGSDEKQKDEVQIKDLLLGAEIAGLSKDRDDYLQKQAEAQFAVPEAQLVEAVRKVLARHRAFTKH